MLFPVRCFTCGGVVAHLQEEYYKMIKEGMKPSEIFDKLKIKRYCCRRMFLSHIELIDETL